MCFNIIIHLDCGLLTRTHTKSFSGNEFVEVVWKALSRRLSGYLRYCLILTLPPLIIFIYICEMDTYTRATPPIQYNIRTHLIFQMDSIHLHDMHLKVL